MARKRDPRRDEAFELWKASKGKKKLKDIAEELGVSDTQIRKWKSQDKWEASKGNVTNSKSNVTNAQKRNRGAPEGNDNAKGNRGNRNPATKFPDRNTIQKKHGLFSKFLHEEQVEIIDALEGMNFADQLWIQIEIKFSAIIRMQKIMWVEDSEDHLKEQSGFSSGESSDSVSYKVAFAYERYEAYIKAQARAMAEYRNLVKQYLELTDEFDERRLKLEQMQVGIDKTRMETAKLTGESSADYEDDGFIEALGDAAEVWNDDDDESTD